MKITVYSKSNCTNCVAVKNLLKARELTYTEVNLDDGDERLAFYDRCGPSVRQLPQVFVNDERIGGLVGLQEWLKWKAQQS